MKKLMLGNEAVAHGAYEAGVKVATAYPGTPSTEITEYIAQMGDMFCEWSPNEKVALEVAAGASAAGARAICSMKHVGLNVAADPLFTLSYTGVNGGLVICVADDPGMHSSQNEQDSRHYAVGAKILMLEPSDSAECRAFLMRGLELSEEYDTPVLLRLATRVSHSRSFVEAGEFKEIQLRSYVKDPGKYVMMPAMAKVRHEVVEARTKKLEAFAETTDLNRVEMAKTDGELGKIGIITSGMAYQYSKEVFGDEASYLKLGMVNPLPVKLIEDFASSVDTCYVIEELDPVIENHCKAAGISVTGKELIPITGELSAEIIGRVILNRDKKVFPNMMNTPARPPVLCPGCPHRGTFTAIKQLGLTVTGDIGCYTLSALPPLQTLDTCLCMGASIGMAHGMQKATEGSGRKDKLVAVLGDSTFIHSGITGLIDVVYNKGTSTVIILDNSITGMTGHQENPATGKTIRGEATKQVDLKKLCEAVGVERVRVVDPFDLKNFKNILKEETETQEPSVIIAQRPCVLLKSVKKNNPYRIVKENCRECGACLKIGCPALFRNASDEGRITVNEALCVGCGYCANICAFGAIEGDVNI